MVCNETVFEKLVIFGPGQMVTAFRFLTNSSQKLIAAALLKPTHKHYLSTCLKHIQYKTIKQQLIKLYTSKTIQELANEIKEGEMYIKNAG